MGFVYLLLTVIGESSTNIIDRLNFKRNNIGFKHLMLFSFLAADTFLVLFVLLTRQPFPQLGLVALSWLLFIISISFIANIFDALSLKSDDLSLREPLVDFYPILAGLVGYIAFPAERRTAVLIAFIVGIVVIWWGVRNIKLRRLQKKGIGYLMLATGLYALLPSIYQVVLQYISPTYIMIFRITGIILLVLLTLRPKLSRGATRRRVGYCMASGLACAISAVAGLYAIQAYGVVVTMLFTMLGPALRYLAGQFILGERIKRTEVLMSLILTLVVAVAAFTRW